MFASVSTLQSKKNLVADYHREIILHTISSLGAMMCCLHAKIATHLVGVKCV